MIQTFNKKYKIKNRIFVPQAYVLEFDNGDCYLILEPEPIVIPNVDLMNVFAHFSYQQSNERILCLFDGTLFIKSLIGSSVK